MASLQFDKRQPVIPVRALKKERTVEFGKLQIELLYKSDQYMIDREEAQFAVEHFWIGALKNAVLDGDVIQGSPIADQSVGLVDEIQPLKNYR